MICFWILICVVFFPSVSNAKFVRTNLSASFNSGQVNRIILDDTLLLKGLILQTDINQKYTNNIGLGFVLNFSYSRYSLYFSHQFNHDLNSKFNSYLINVGSNIRLYSLKFNPSDGMSISFSLGSPIFIKMDSIFEKSHISNFYRNGYNLGLSFNFTTIISNFNYSINYSNGGMYNVRDTFIKLPDTIATSLGCNIRMYSSIQLFMNMGMSFLLRDIIEKNPYVEFGYSIIDTKTRISISIYDLKNIIRIQIVQSI